MQILEPTTRVAEVIVFQPRWYRDDHRAQRFSFRLVPVLGALRDAGWRVILLEESRDPPGPSWAPLLERATAAVAWLGEMYPGTQIAGLRSFFDVVGLGPRRPVVIGGGFFPVIDLEGLDLGRIVEAVVSGPGELVLPEVLGALREGRPVAGIAGVATWEGGRFVSVPPGPRRPLDPAWNSVLEDLDLSGYFGSEGLVFDNEEPTIQILTALGCAKSCPFCFDELNPLGVFAAHAVVDAIASVQRKYGVRQFLMGELDFFHARARAMAIARELRDRCQPMRWFALASVCDLERLSDEDLRLLAESGCHRLEVGTESGSDILLRRLGKRHCVSDALRVAGRLAAAGIRLTHNIILGPPGETRDDRARTLRLIAALRRVDARAGFNFRMYQIVPNTTLGQEALGFVEGFPRSLDDIERYRVDFQGGLRALPWLPAEEEAWVRLLVDYLLPVGWPSPANGRRRVTEHVFAWLARMHCRTGVRRGAETERRLFEASSRHVLQSTFVE
jgi:hypothetical protein